jgi:CheY-like chemotaxis protein
VPEEKIPSRGQEPPPKILVVEDNELLMAMLERVLRYEGYEVIPAPSGAQMTKVLHTSKPDLILLDVGLPDADGRDLLAALKKDPRTRSIPVLIWSGTDAESDRRLARELGAEDYVLKGEPESLIPNIQRILDRLSEREIATARSSKPPRN